MECIFCQIANGRQKADIVYQDKEVIVFKDIHPKARVHVLIVPKRHLTGIQTLRSEDSEIAGRLLLTAKVVAEKLGVLNKGFKLMVNCGRSAGQEIDHLHIHLLAN